MPYVLSNIISKDQLGLWGEGAPYSTSVIFDIHHQTNTSPPVHYESHVLKPHSLPHLDAPSHILENGHSVDDYYKSNHLSGFFGKTYVVRLKGNKFVSSQTNPNIHVWTVSKEDLQSNLSPLVKSSIKRILITFDDYPVDEFGNHDQNKVLVLSEDATHWLLKNNPNLCLYGTSWKSTDYQPGSKERPIHKLLFEKSVTIFECLNLKNVPSGEYFWFAFPLPLEGASESPVCPVLFTESEMNEMMKD